MLRVVDEFNYGEFEGMAATKNFEAVVIGAPSFVLVGQHGEAGNGSGIAVEEPIVVGEHAQWEIPIPLTLNLNVDVDPAFHAICQRNLRQGIGKTSAEFSIAYYLPKFGVSEPISFCPIDLSVGFREVERHELGKGVFKHFFPGAVVGVGLLVRHACASFIFFVLFPVIPSLARQYSPETVSTRNASRIPEYLGTVFFPEIGHVRNFGAFVQ